VFVPFVSINSNSWFHAKAAKIRKDRKGRAVTSDMVLILSSARCASLCWTLAALLLSKGFCGVLDSCAQELPEVRFLQIVSRLHLQMPELFSSPDKLSLWVVKLCPVVESKIHMVGVHHDVTKALRAPSAERIHQRQCIAAIQSLAGSRCFSQNHLAKPQSKLSHSHIDSGQLLKQLLARDIRLRHGFFGSVLFPGFAKPFHFRSSPESIASQTTIEVPDSIVRRSVFSNLARRALAGRFDIANLLSGN